MWGQAAPPVDPVANPHHWGVGPKRPVLAGAGAGSPRTPQPGGPSPCPGHRPGAPGPEPAEQQAQRRPAPVTPSVPSCLTARLHQSPGVLFYDIEADPDARENYLHGFLSLTPQDPGSPWGSTGDLTGTSAQHHPILCLPRHGDGRCWQRIHRFLNRFPGWPMLHYGETERIELLRLAHRVGASTASREDLQQRFVDVHQLVRQQWVLPLAAMASRVWPHGWGFAGGIPRGRGLVPCCGGVIGVAMGIATTCAASWSTTGTTAKPPVWWRPGFWPRSRPHHLK